MTDHDLLSLRGPVKSCELYRSISTGFETGFQTREVAEFRHDGLFRRRHCSNPPPHPDWGCSYEYDADGRLLEERVEQAGVVILVRRREYDSVHRLSRVRESWNNGDERVTETCSYQNGAKKKVVLLQPGVDGYGVEGTDSAYGAPGADTMTAIYDQYEKPIEQHFHDKAGNLVTRVDLRYDDRGNLIEEICTTRNTVAQIAAILCDEQLDELRKHDVFGRRHIYDARNRRIESLTMFSGPSLRQRFTYNEQGDMSSEVSETPSPDSGIGEEGVTHSRADSARLHRSETRMQYQYDLHGNWIEKIVESPDGQVWSVERRTITYFDSDTTP